MYDKRERLAPEYKLAEKVLSAVEPTEDDEHVELAMQVLNVWNDGDPSK